MAANSNAKAALDDAVNDVGVAAKSQIDQTIGDLAERAERVAQETLNNLRERAKPYVGDASEHIATAERYLVERVQKQPLTTTLAVLGVGVLVGLVLAGGRHR